MSIYFHVHLVQCIFPKQSNFNHGREYPECRRSYIWLRIVSRYNFNSLTYFVFQNMLLEWWKFCQKIKQISINLKYTFFVK
jgi:hypothetical protein